jgi:predicted nucleotidyltransferase
MLEDILGTKAAIRILRVFCSNPNRFFFEKEIAEQAGVGAGVNRDTLHRLSKEQILEKEKRGRMNYYRLNVKNELALKIMELFHLEDGRYPTLSYVHKSMLSYYLSKLERISGDNLLFVVLYGSVARGTAGPASDVDLQIVLEKKEKRDKITSLNVRTSEKFGTGISAEVLDLNNLKSLIRSREPIIKEIQNEGIVLYGDEKEYRELLKGEF